MEPQDFRPNVEKGARWLEEKGAWDWPDKILAAVEGQTFEMVNCRHCAVGVTLGDFYDHFGDYDREAYARGFSVPCDSDSAPQWRMLEEEWVTYAREEQAARAGGCVIDPAAAEAVWRQLGSGT